MKVQTSGEDDLKAMLVPEKKLGDELHSMDLARYQKRVQAQCEPCGCCS